MFYHASNTADIKTLIPFSSGHGTPLVYFSTKKENTLVYLSNPVEKYCKEIGLESSDRYYRFMSYRFTEDNILEVLEYWPNALEGTYAGVSGYIYATSQLPNAKPMDIPYVTASEAPVTVESAEYIPDTYLALKQAEKEGKLRIVRYHENSTDRLDKIKKLVCREYEKAQTIPTYKAFLEAKFNRFIQP
ncbi:MAG: hypothetical protein IKB07_07130 [Lachnospiraceae bacterium]|nr:hypothetical protein [Lachnospiraceae bacterium]